MNNTKKPGFFMPENLASVQAGFNDESSCAEISIITRKMGFVHDQNGQPDPAEVFESLQIIAGVEAIDHIIAALQEVKNKLQEKENKQTGGPIKTLGNA